MPDGEVVENHSNAVKPLDRNCGEISVVNQIEDCLPKHKAQQSEHHQPADVFQTPKRQQGQDSCQQHQGCFNQVQVGLHDEKSIFHVDFESVEELIDLIGLKGPLVGVVAEGEGAQVDVEEVVEDAASGEEQPQVGGPGD